MICEALTVVAVSVRFEEPSFALESGLEEVEALEAFLGQILPCEKWAHSWDSLVSIFGFKNSYSL
jgi:hypothetical protein